MSKSVEQFNIEENTLRLEATSRGGGIEVSLDALGKKYEGVKMTAYQNYLGGGILGRILNSCNLREWEKDAILIEMGEKLARYFHSLTNHEEDEYESASFEENQKRPASAY